jgi:HEAT repeat protein
VNTRVLLAIAFGIVTGIYAVCQENRSRQIDDKTVFTQHVQTHKLPSTKAALVKALRNHDPDVRWLAAQRLADEGERDAIPAILKALSSETVPLTRANLAYAVARFGEEKGFATLKSICDTPVSETHLESLRLTAARDLLDFDNESCLPTVFEFMPSEPHHLEILALLPRFKHVSAADSQRILDFAIQSLDSSDGAVKLFAGTALENLDNPAGIPPLEHAIAIEDQQAIRLGLERNLQALQKQKATAQ